MEHHNYGTDDRSWNLEPPEKGASIRVIVWNDLFVVVDDGSGSVSDYNALRELILQRARTVTRDLGCLAIIPTGAMPPTPDARKALDNALFGSPLRCICWLVEGEGFQSAMVRAVLTGLRFLKHRKYPTHISATLEDALSWMLPRLEGGPDRVQELHRSAEYIRAQRDSASYAHVL